MENLWQENESCYPDSKYAARFDATILIADTLQLTTTICLVFAASRFWFWVSIYCIVALLIHRYY